MGVITAIIGAVRIGGPGWLRAIVGRAKENFATAEVELTTSTSSNACELWDGEVVVRLLGAPKITEFIYFPELPKDEGGTQGVRLYTVDTAKEKLRDESEWKQWVGSFIAPRPPVGRGTTTQERRSLPNTDEESQRIDSSARSKASNEALNPQPTKSAPNISINLSPTRNRWELRLFAFIGVLLQSGVIVFSGCAAFNPQLDQTIGGEQSLPYGYPLAAVGTLVLVAGMLICSFVMEASTRETLWRAKENRFRIMWLQQRANVNDQDFDSYAIFSEGERDFVMKSCLDQGNCSKPGMLTQTLVIVGTLASLIGFIVQSAGFRSMHWPASVAQLAATLIMAVVRTYIRRARTIWPGSQKIPYGHELDWLATRIGAAEDEERLWHTERGDTFLGRFKKCLYGKGWNRAASDTAADSGHANSSEMFWSKKCWNWGIVTASNTEAYRFHLPADVRAASANEVVRVRGHIGRLSKWTVTASDAAVALANASKLL